MNFSGPVFGGEVVDGDDVDIDLCCGGGAGVAGVAGGDGEGCNVVNGLDSFRTLDAGVVAALGADGDVRTCVCILVFTTSICRVSILPKIRRKCDKPRGQVMTPAKPPANPAVAISNGNPISLDPQYDFAAFWNCS